MEQSGLKSQDSTLKTLLNTACPLEKYVWMGVMIEISEKLSGHVLGKLGSIYLIEFSMA